MHTGSPAPDQRPAGGEEPRNAWGELTRVQADAVRATAAATGSDPDRLARDLVPLLRIPPGSGKDPAVDQ